MRNYDPKATQFFLKPYGFKFRINWKRFIFMNGKKERPGKE
jgi:hypothetical protein